MNTTIPVRDLLYGEFISVGRNWAKVQDIVEDTSNERITVYLEGYDPITFDADATVEVYVEEEYEEESYGRHRDQEEYYS